MHSTPKVFIISLINASKRRKHMSSLLDKYSIDYEFIDAVNGKALSDMEIENIYDSESSRFFFGRDMSRSEIGCALSQILAYKTIIQEKLSGAIILEDDCAFSSNFKEVATHIHQQADPSEPAVILFQHHRYYAPLWCKKIIKDHKLCSIKQVWSNASGAYGYYVTQQAAKSLINYHVKIPHVIDYWDRMIRKNIINLYCIVPYCVGIADIGKHSQITDRPTDENPQGKLWKPWYRGLEQQLANILKVLRILKKQKQSW